MLTSDKKAAMASETVEMETFNTTEKPSAIEHGSTVEGGMKTRRRARKLHGNGSQNGRNISNRIGQDSAKHMADPQYQTFLNASGDADTEKKPSSSHSEQASQFILTAADGIFPGFREKYKSAHKLISNRDSVIVHRSTPAVRIRSSLPVQLIIYASWGYFMTYLVCVLGTLDITLNGFRGARLMAMLLLRIGCFTTNLWRCWVGITANRHDDALNMTWYWMLTLAQVPLLSFVLLSDLYPSAFTLIVTLDIILIVFVIAELLISFSHTHSLLAHEVKLMTRAQIIDSNPPPRVRNTKTGPVVQAGNPDRYTKEESEFETDSEESSEKVDYGVYRFAQPSTGSQKPVATATQEIPEREKNHREMKINPTIKTLFYPPDVSDHSASSDDIEEPGDSLLTIHSNSPESSLTSHSDEDSQNNKQELPLPDRYYSNGGKFDPIRIDSLNPSRKIQEEQKYTASAIATMKSRKTILRLNEPEPEEGQCSGRGYFDSTQMQSQEHVSKNMTKYRFKVQRVTLETEVGVHGISAGKQEVEVLHAAIKERNDGSSSSISEFADAQNIPSSKLGTKSTVLKVEELSSSGSSNTTERHNGGKRLYSSASFGNRDQRSVAGSNNCSSTTSFDEETNGSIASLPFSNLNLLENKQQQRFDLATATSLPSTGSISSHVSDELISRKEGAGQTLADAQTKASSKYRK